jgi:hypothetical protein
MPTITFADGTSSYIPDKNPETIAKAKTIHAENKKRDVNVLGDVGRQAVRGVQKIGEGAATTVTSAIDYFADTDLTADVKEHFEKIDIGEAQTTAGEITRYMVQFGLPGFGVAGVLGRMGKMGKVKAALTGGLVDGAVATDDVVTLKDTFFDNESESDEIRMSRLRGAEAAAARLQDKLEVAAEGASFILGIPLAGKAVAKTGGAAIDFVAPVGSFMAKGLMAGKKVLRPGELQKSAFDSNTGIYNALKRNFTYGGDTVDTYVKSTMAAKTSQIKTAQESVDAVFDTVLNTTGLAVNNGTLNQSNALKLSRNIEDFMFENAGLYGTRVYKAIVDKGYKINPDYKKKALTEIENTYGVDPREANEMFEGLINPGPKNKTSFAFETNDMLLEGLNRDQAILKGRKLSSLPQVRRALGESAGYLESNWQTALANTKLTASVTAQRLSSLTAKTQMFNNLKGDIGDSKIQTILDKNGERVTFKQFNKDAGALEGSFAREDVHDALMGAMSDQSANSGILRKLYTGLLSVKAASQYGKTVLSGGAQVRNFTSIPFFSMLNGNLGSTGRFVDAVETSFAGLFDPKKRVLKTESIQELIEEGMMQKGGANLGEIREIAKLASDVYSDSFVGAATRAVGTIVDKSGIRLAEKAYGMTDDGCLPI